MKKTTKNNTGLPVIEATTSTAELPKKSEDEIELEELLAIRDGLLKRSIGIDSRLGILIDQLQRKIQSH